MNLTQPVNSLLNGITNELSANWPIIAGAIGAAFGLGVLLLFVERYLRDHDRSLFLDEGGMRDWYHDEELHEHLELLAMMDEREVDELNEEIVASQSVWHVASWDELDEDEFPGWRWLGDDELVHDHEASEHYDEKWDTSDSVAPGEERGSFVGEED